MPAPSKYPTAHEQLRLLAEAARRDGLSFQRFWELAVRPGQPAITWSTPAGERPPRCVVWPRDTTDRKLSIAATLGAKDGWRRAYEGVPPSGPEKALQLLAPLMQSLEHAVLGSWEPVAELPPEQLTLLPG
ncbi:MAG TPA: hypothetical protein VF192_01360 [Longimicrobiales bacterium]